VCIAKCGVGCGSLISCFPGTLLGYFTKDFGMVLVAHVFDFDMFPVVPTIDFEMFLVVPTIDF